MYQYKKIRLKGKGVVDEHRYIMQKHLGRRLSFNEVVHHKDGNKRNNSIENLELISRSEHAKLHYKNNEILVVKGKFKGKEACKKRSVVTEEIAKEIKSSRKKGVELSKIYGVSKFVISRIRCGTSWKHI